MTIHSSATLAALLRYLFYDAIVHSNAEFYYWTLLFDGRWEIPMEELFVLAQSQSKMRYKANRLSVAQYIRQNLSVQIDLFTPPVISEKLRNAYLQIGHWQKIYAASDLQGIVNLVDEAILASNAVREILFSGQSLLEMASQLDAGAIRTANIERLPSLSVLPAMHKFVLSASSLNKFLSCPLSFLFQQVFKLPNLTNDAVKLGILLHAVLDRLFKEMRQRNNQFPSKEWLLDSFEKDFRAEEKDFITANKDAVLSHAKDLLSAYYDTRIADWNVIAITEYRIAVEKEGIRLKGFLDKLEFEGRSLRIVDYKSGNTGRGMLRLQKPSSALPNGGEYWRQAVFYKILVDASDKNWQVENVCFDFLEASKLDNQEVAVKLSITEEDENVVWQQIKSVTAAIEKEDFYSGCKQPECVYCQIANLSSAVIS